jgi:hypothetical protein
MAKRYDEVVDVTLDGAADGVPLTFSWRGRNYTIDERLGSWREAGEWWDPSGVHEREYFRVLAHPAGAGATGELDPDGFLVTNSSVYDLYRDRMHGVWRLARLWD